MATAVLGKFSCDHCGKQFAWKPELAGRKAKCKCGNVLTVPASESASAPSPAPARSRPAAPPPPPPPPPVQNDDDDYDFKEEEPPPVPVAKRAIPVTVTPTPVGGAVGAAVAPIGYRGQRTAEEKRKEDRFSFWAMLDVKRDVYAPIAILLAGFASIIGWAMYNIDAGALAIVVVSIGTAIVTVVKTIVLTLGAIIIAPRFGLSFGDLRTALLKIAAIVVFTDGVMIWLPWGGVLGLRGLAYGTIFQGMIMGALCLYLFDMERDETAMFAVPFALVSKITGVVLTLAAAGIIMNMAGVNSGGGGGFSGSRGNAAAAAPFAAGPGPLLPGADDLGDDESDPDDPRAAPQAPPPPPLPPKERAAKADQAILAVVDRGFLVREARQFRARGTTEIPPIAEKFYTAGAPAVWIDLGGGRVYVELSDEPAARAACFAQAAKPADLDGMVADAALLQDLGQRFITLNTPPPAPPKAAQPAQPAQPAAPPPPGKKTSDVPF